MKNYKLHFIVLLVIGSFSCTKVKQYDPIGDGSQHYIQFLDIGGTDKAYGFKASNVAFADASAPQENYSLKVQLSSSNVSSGDITVTLKVDTTLVAAYNSTQTLAKDKYFVLPTNCYNIPATTVKIKANQQVSEEALLSFFPVNVDKALNFMLPIRITAISGASSEVVPATNTGIAYLHFIGNPLAGIYQTTGYFYHPSSPRAVIRANDVLEAIDGNSLGVELADLGPSGYYAILYVPDPASSSIQNVTIQVYPGSISPLVQWNNALPSPYVPAWPNSPLCNNTYDPATKTFYLRYGYSGSGGFRVTEEVIKR